VQAGSLGRCWAGAPATILKVFEVERAHIELFARSLEQDGKARATVARRLSTIAGFYRYCVEEQLIPGSPALHLRRPRLEHELNPPGGTNTISGVCARLSRCVLSRAAGTIHHPCNAFGRRRR
jgi:Phage integrase, N-terminal SAM-like domain